MPAAVTLIRADGLLPAVPYAVAATVPPEARLVVLAGACPLDAHGRVTAVGDVAGQTTACLATMGTALRAAGAELADVVFVRVLVASSMRDDLATAWDVVHEAFGDHEPPGTLMGVTVLGWEHQLVEIEAVAAVLDV
ncbi:MAG TPA: Rid family hydrolase [Amnibacterium sp.]